MNKKETRSFNVFRKGLGRKCLSFALAVSMLAGSVPVNAAEISSDSYLAVGEGGTDGGQDTGLPLEENSNVQDSLLVDESADSASTGALEGASGGEYGSGNADDQTMYIDNSGSGADGTGQIQTVPLDQAAAIVETSAGRLGYASASEAWDAAAAEAGKSGTAVFELCSDWVSDENGFFGSGANFSNEGSIAMDLGKGKISILGGGHTILRNGPAASGGCVISVFSGNLDISNAIISGGNSTTAGGAILNVGGSVLLDKVALRGNHAMTGGGICALGGSLVVNDSEISQNSADDMGGGIYVDTDKASLALMGTVSVSGNSSSAAGDLYLSGNKNISLDGLNDNSSLSVGADYFEGSRSIASGDNNIAKCVVSADAAFEIVSENGLIFLSFIQTEEPEANAEEQPETTEEPEANAEEQPETTEEPEANAEEQPETTEEPEANTEEQPETTEEPEANAEEQPETEVQAAYVQSARTLGENVNMRAEASIESNVVLTIKETGTLLEVMDTVSVGEETWVHVRLNGQEGYIRSDLLEMIETDQEEEVVTPDDSQEENTSDVEENEDSNSENGLLLSENSLLLSERSRLLSGSPMLLGAESGGNLDEKTSGVDLQKPLNDYDFAYYITNVAVEGNTRYLGGAFIAGENEGDFHSGDNFDTTQQPTLWKSYFVPMAIFLGSHAASNNNPTLSITAQGNSNSRDVTLALAGNEVAYHQGTESFTESVKRWEL